MINARVSFGYTCIDQLIDRENLGYGVINENSAKPIVACIVGPDGVGKSILALSAASTYAAGKDRQSRVIYASTDLNYDQAKSTWAHFHLEFPCERREKLFELESLYLDNNLVKQAEIRDKKQKRKLSLTWVSPFLNDAMKQGLQYPIDRIFENRNDSDEVHFVDLASYSGGDDWGLINQLVGLLNCKLNDRNTTPHLLIVDAVEGLETMAGHYDRFGLNRSRRSRLAQLVRLTRKANCHVVFVVEQKSDADKLDEVFISDLVLRLRAEKVEEYLQKTIEIEKARSVSHIRGPQELQIRDGRGSGIDIPNDPEINHNGKYIGYIQVIPSLHQRSYSEGRNNVAVGNA